jgi:AmmeMemoRadiSam system protein B
MSTSPQFDPNAPHMQSPRLRPVRGFRAQAPDGQEAIGLADARQVSDRVVFTAPAAQLILPHMDGKKTLDQIVQSVGRGLTRPIIEGLVAQLDEAGLLFGPTFDAMLTKMRQEFDSSSVLPPASTAAMADALADQEIKSTGATPSEEEKLALGARKLREAFDTWIAAALKDVPNPSLDELPKAIVAPHIDYPRGWLNYAAVWGRLRVADRPDRVLILGTNHFGEATGVCGCDKGYESPLGVSEIDAPLLEALKSALGADNAAKFLANRYDHEREHSVELQIPWIQHCLGADDSGAFCKVLGVLVHDPTVNNGESYDGKGLALPVFIEALKKALAQVGGRTLIVASADLSHVGPAFGDPKSLAGEDDEAKAMRDKVFNHDREMIQMIIDRKPDELIAAMSWQQNPTRWCSLGNLVATMKVTEPTHVELYNFAASMDEGGTTLVSNVGMAMN